LSYLNLVVAELPTGICIDMLSDRKIHIISDGALFLITTTKHSTNYPELKFSLVSKEGLEAYEIHEFLFRECGESKNRCFNGLISHTMMSTLVLNTTKLMSEIRNRLILIGNGFDIAAGLNTSYSSFILEMAKKSAINGLNQKPGNNLFDVKTTHKGKNLEIIKSAFQKTSNLKELFEHIKMYECEISFEGRHDFIEHIIYNYRDSNWIDIEKSYYEHLVLEYDNFLKRLSHKRNYDHIKLLNISMDLLTNNLNEYILGEQEKLDPTRALNLNDLLDRITRPNRDEQKIEKNLAVNFNYTNALKSILQKRNLNEVIKFIHIHGAVDDPKNSIIFGYGDDTGQNYKKLELAEENEILRLIKSFQYSRTSNYTYLLEYLHALPFEVVILGHSCGLSDKTMLETIFGHDNCRSIEAYHYKGYEEFFDKTISISRHFQDKKKYRERLLDFNTTAAFP